VSHVYPLPTEAIISVTNRCDARCRMCNIWQLEPHERLTPEDYRRLPNSLKDVNLTGGEPLLRKDIVEVAHAIFEAAGRPRIILATNGFRTEKTLATVQRIRQFVPTLAIAVSLDGSKETHDHMRGVQHAHERAVHTIRSLQDAGIKDIRIGFTATADNIAELTDVYDLTQALGVQFTATVAQNSDIYYATDRNGSIEPDAVADAFGALIGKRMRSGSIKDWVRAYFDHGVIEFVRSGKRLSACHAGSDFFFLTPTGEVYPCLTLPESIGNLRTRRFEELWNSESARRVREMANGCQKCWMMCTARSELKRRPAKVVSWVLEQQMSRHLRSMCEPTDHGLT
jgi:Fe-coproporphyrin III synthase